MKNNYMDIMLDFKYNLEKNKLYLFGAGQTCHDYLKLFPFKSNVVCIFDNDDRKHGIFVDEIPVFSATLLDEIDYAHSMFLITTYYANEIYQRLRMMGIKNIYHFMEVAFNQQAWVKHVYLPADELNLLSAKKLLADAQSCDVLNKIIDIRKGSGVFWGYDYDYDAYFSKDILKLSTREVFVDGGAFNGDTIRQFMQHTDNSYKQIFAFEPDKINYEKLKFDLEENSKIITINAGLWSQSGQARFCENGTSSLIDENGSATINVVSIDEQMEIYSGKPSFIKLDIINSSVSELSFKRP